MRRDVFQAIADPTRRAIITLIAQRAMTPNSLAESFKISRQAISKHLKILMECGLIVVKKQGRERIYEVQPKKLEAITQWMNDFYKVWDQRFSYLDIVLEKLKTYKNTT